MKTELQKITLTQRPDHSWDVTRERKYGSGGETATGFRNLALAIDYIKGHDFDEWAAHQRQQEIETAVQVKTK